MKNLQTLFCKFLLILFSIILTFIFLELAARVFSRQSTTIQERDSDIVWKYKPNLDTVIEAEGGGKSHIITNSYGFLGPERSKEKREDVVRIANLGDSFTAGLTVDFDKNYVGLIENILTDKLDRQIESLNFGVAGQGTGEALETYRHYAREFNPDVVILWFFLGNDFEDNVVFSEKITSFDSSISFFEKIKNVARQSELAQLIVNRLARIPSIANFMHGRVLNRVGDDTESSDSELPLTVRLIYTDDPENGLAIERTKAKLGQLKEEVMSDEASLFVVMVPVNFAVEPMLTQNLLAQYPGLSEKNFDTKRPNVELSAILQELSINYMDLTPIFLDKCTEICTLYACPHCHLSAEGHSVAAEAVGDCLEKRLFNAD